jgi:hypothetical protein
MMAGGVGVLVNLQIIKKHKLQILLLNNIQILRVNEVLMWHIMKWKRLIQMLKNIGSF